MVEPDGSSGSASMRVGAFFFLVNPDRIVGRRAFDMHVAGWVDRYLEASAEGAPIPGERAAARERDAASNGITLPLAIVEELYAVGWDWDVPFGVEARLE
jgi:LDH2 family malate/lactate/ureidoglycolate dehydrogenase